MANHIGDWVWRRWLENHPERQSELGAKAEEQFRRLTDGQCRALAVLRDLADGVKHLQTARGKRPLPATTGHLEMTGIPFIAPNHEWVAFAVVTADGSLDVYRRGSRAGVLPDALAFWRAFIERHGKWGQHTAQ